MIKRFKDEYAFLSNFYFVEIDFEGISYMTVEHAYQAAKTNDIDYKKMVARAETPGLAKKKGQKLDLIENWDTYKLVVMEKLLRMKFSQDKFKKLLIQTGDEELVEGNTWNDTFWGVCKGVGENHLGKLLMKIRKELQCPFDFDFIKEEVF